MRVLKTILAGSVPVGLVVVAFLNAKAVTSLVEATVDTSLVMPHVGAASIGEALPAAPRPTADAILDRNPFDHVTGSLRPPNDAPIDDGRSIDNEDPFSAPLCEGVRSLVVVGAKDQKVAFAALDYGGQRLLRRQGGEVGPAEVAYVGDDRVWLRGRTEGSARSAGDRGRLCQAPVHGAPPPPPPVKVDAPARPGSELAVGGTRSATELAIEKKIMKTGPNEYAIDRSAVDLILEAQTELMKSRIVPEKEGDRVVGVRVLNVKPGSVLSMLGIENNDRLETINGMEVSSPEKMLEVYARIRGGAADKMQIHLTRGGKPLNIDYAIK